MTSVRLETIEQIFRAEYGRAVAALVRRCGSIDEAEEVVQEAFAEAVQRWPTAGLPASPAGWIITTARNRAIDRHRREASREERHAQTEWLEPQDSDEDAAVRDDQLRLMFTCCHPALARSAQVALTLRLIGGLTTPEIAHAFLVPEATLAQRIVRAKNKIRDAGIPYRIPDEDELPARLDAVLAVIYLIFNEGYKASSGPNLTRESLSREAIRLGRLTVELMPEPEAFGLLALMLFTEARRAARVNEDGEIVLLAAQDRSRWDRKAIEEGLLIVERCFSAGKIGPYQLQAAINAVHMQAKDVRDTDWARIVELYDHLLALTPNPVVALNKAVAVAEVQGPQAALELVEACALEQFYLFHAIRADLLDRCGRDADALAAYDIAIAKAENEVECALLKRKRAAVLDRSVKER